MPRNCTQSLEKGCCHSLPVWMNGSYIWQFSFAFSLRNNFFVHFYFQEDSLCYTWQQYYIKMLKKSSILWGALTKDLFLDFFFQKYDWRLGQSIQNRKLLLEKGCLLKEWHLAFSLPGGHVCMYLNPHVHFCWPH